MYPESTMRRTSDRSRWNVTRVYERRVSPDHRYCGAWAARTGHSLLEKPRPDGAQWGPGDGHTVSELQWRDALCMTCSDSEAGGNSAINCKAVTVIQSLIEMWFALCQGDGCEIRQANNHGMGVSIKVIHSLEQGCNNVEEMNSKDAHSILCHRQQHSLTEKVQRGRKSIKLLLPAFYHKYG